MKLKLICTLAFASLLGSQPSGVAARTWLINASGTGDAPTIQAGVDSAVGGDTLSLIPGVFKGSGNRAVDFCGKAIVVTTSGEPEETVIDAEFLGNAFIFQSGEGPSSVLSRLTIRHGQGDIGGNVRCENSSPTISDCILTEGVGEGAYGGGGIQCRGAADPHIARNTFTKNNAPLGAAVGCYGGASPTIIGNVFVENSTAIGGWGGAIYCEQSSNPTVANNLIKNNYGGYGGGIHCCESSSPLIDGNQIVGNSSLSGGGIYCYDSTPTISNNVISRNTASHGGGGIFCGCPVAHIVNNTIVENSEIGIQLYRVVTPTDPLIENNIIAYTSVGAGVACTSPPGRRLPNPTLKCNVIFANAGGDTLCGVDGGGNVAADPQFCGVIGSGNYFLQSDSPCAPGNHPGEHNCGLIGACPVNCGNVGAQKRSWGSIKSLYEKDE